MPPLYNISSSAMLRKIWQMRWGGKRRYDMVRLRGQRRVNLSGGWLIKAAQQMVMVTQENVSTVPPET